MINNNFHFYILFTLVVIFSIANLYADNNSEMSVQEIYEETMRTSDQTIDDYASLKENLALIENILLEIDKRYFSGEVTESDLFLLNNIINELEKRIRYYSD